MDTNRAVFNFLEIFLVIEALEAVNLPLYHFMIIASDIFYLTTSLCHGKTAWKKARHLTFTFSYRKG